MEFLRFIPPKLTELARDSIASPEDGEVVYNLDTNQLNVYNGTLTIWEPVGSGGNTVVGAFARIINSSQQQLNTTGQTSLNFDTLDEKDALSGLSLSSNRVVVDKAGVYTLAPFLGIDSNNTQRADPFLKLTLNGSVIQDSLGRDIRFTGLYARNAGVVEFGGGNLSITKTLSAGDEIGVITERGNTNLNQVFTIPNATFLEVKAWQTATTTGTTTLTRVPYHFTQRGQASSTAGLFSKSRSSAFGADFGLPTSSASDQYVNGGLDPYRVGDDKRIKRVLFNTSASAVGAGTVGATVSASIQVYTIQNTSETLLTTFVIPLDPSNVGTFNNLGGTTSNKSASFNTDFSIPNNAMIGIRFLNIASSSTQLNAIGFTNVTLEIE